MKSRCDIPWRQRAASLPRDNRAAARSGWLDTVTEWGVSADQAAGWPTCVPSDVLATVTSSQRPKRGAWSLREKVLPPKGVR